MSRPMDGRTLAFCAYPFTTAKKEFYEQLKQSLPTDLIDLHLPHQHYQPAMIWSRIRPVIDSAQLCLIDAEHPNPNVSFECGYAVAKGLHPILIRHHDTQEDILPCFQAFQHLVYYLRHDLIDRIVELISQPDWASQLPNPMDDIAGVSPDAYPNLAPYTDIYLLAVRARQDPVLRLKRELGRRPYSVHSDAIESAARLSTRDIIKSLVRFNNVAIHLVGESRSNYDELMTLNSVAAFFGGVAHGLGKELRVFQQMPTPKDILDLEAMLSRYDTEGEVSLAARSWKEEFEARAATFEERRRATAAVLAPPGTATLPSDLGDPAAERDGLLNSDTFTTTPRTSRIRNGDGLLYVGPRGCGKSADYINLIDQQGSTSTRLTVAVKLTDADIISLRGIGQEFFSDVDRRNIYRHIWRLALVALLIDEYERLKGDLTTLHAVPEFDAGSTEIAALFGNSPGREIAEMVSDLVSTLSQLAARYRNSQELIRELAFPTGRRLFAAAIRNFDIRIAIDGLDQGWDPSLKEATELLVALIEEVHDLEQRFRPNLKVAIFALQELYQHIARQDRDSDKRSVDYYTWDRDQLADMIGTRILAVTAGQHRQEDPRHAWSMIFEKSINGKNTFDYIVERSLMRPRHVLRFCREALLTANNRRHRSVTANDVLQGEELFSGQLIDDLATEYSDRYPGIGDVISELLEVPTLFSYEEFRDRINSIFADSTTSTSANSWLRHEDSSRVLVALKALYEIGIVGIVRGSDVTYSYMQENFDSVWPRERRTRVRRRRRARQRLAPGLAPRYPKISVHPAFQKGLAVQDQ